MLSANDALRNEKTYGLAAVILGVGLAVAQQPSSRRLRPAEADGGLRRFSRRPKNPARIRAGTVDATVGAGRFAAKPTYARSDVAFSPPDLAEFFGLRLNRRSPPSPRRPEAPAAGVLGNRHPTPKSPPPGP